jgi:hypothetical protein
MSNPPWVPENRSPKKAEKSTNAQGKEAEHESGYYRPSHIESDAPDRFEKAVYLVE